MTNSQTGDLRERLEKCLAGPYAAAYRPVVDRLDRFAATTYPITAEGARDALCELIELSTELQQVGAAVKAAKRALFDPYFDEIGVGSDLRSYFFDLAGLS
jgi:hypothetical protein